MRPLRWLKGRVRRDDERGAILVMAAAALVVMTVSAALSVDIGRLAVERRKVQAVADLAALDAVRNIGSASTVAQQTALRNNWDPAAAGHTFTVELGSLDASRTFQSGVGSTAVRVTALSLVKYAFETGQRTVRSSAVAALHDESGFSLGSTLAALNTSNATMLNKIIGPMLGGSLNLSLVSWQGLTSATLTLRALRTKLLNAGITAGSVDELLNTNVNVRQLFQLAASALTDQGLIAAASTMNTIAASISGSTTVKLGTLFNITQGSGSALDMTFSPLPFVTGIAQIVNGSNAVNVSIATGDIGVADTTGTTLSLTVVEKPKIYFGPICAASPVAACVSTAQVQLTVTPTISKNISIPPLIGTKVINSLPYTITAGGADGRLKAINCGASKSITVGVDPKQVTTNSSGTVRLTSTVLGITTALLDVNVSASATTTGSHTDLTFAYPSEFGPPGKHAGSNSVGLSANAYTANSWTVLGSLGGLPAGSVAATVAGTLASTMGSVDTAIIVPALQAIGLEVGAADVQALAIPTSGIACGLFGLVS
jgi:uncharacterized membrane protein